jgi:hypothetical protein
VFYEDRYDSMVEAGIKFLQERRRFERERLEEYLATKEKDIYAHTMNRDNAKEERGDSIQDRTSRMAWITAPDHKFC